ncbi:hypothetical protein Sjap_025563 [Stephania japonica]|uniref:Uncharacterized protein n=1 Tax=Stephania japonica TaxID=461633 RepID=A0AAP0HHN4_9MAGN|nr:COMT protein [Stephania japonica]
MESRGDGDIGEEPITHEELFKAQSHIYKHTIYFINSMSLKCAVELNIPDIIHNHKKPMTRYELEAALQIPQSRSAHLYRLMRILVHNGFYATKKIQDQEEQVGYLLTLSSKLLLKNHNSFPLVFLAPALQEPWQLLSGWLKGGNGGTAAAPFDETHGKGIWEYGLEHLDVINLFNEAMAADSRVVSSVLVTKCKAMFEGVALLVDVGGGTGTMGRVIAEAFPHIKCCVLDVPQVVGSCHGSENLEFVAGDMFHAKIPSADAILLKWILHDWNDEDCLKILKRCREAIVSTEKVGKVIIIDIVMDEKGETHESTELQLMFDMLLMVNMNGIERTEPQWEKLFIESGFTSYKITPFLDFRSIIEVFP